MPRTNFAQLAALLVAFSIYFSPSLSWGWNDHGHMVVAAAAWNNLDQLDKKRVGDLLRLNPDFSAWIKDAPPDLVDETAFLMASIWPDYIKGSHGGYVFDGNEPKSPIAAQNLGYEDKLQHRYWHYIDLPISTDGPIYRPLIEPNALTQIGLFKQAISSDASDGLKSYDLVWLIHLVGDVHQPLHAVSRYTDELRKGDRGGNAVKVCLTPEHCHSTLHELWDNALGTGRSIKKAITDSSKLPPPDADVALNINEEVWVHESRDLALRYVYMNPIGNGSGPYPVTKRYRDSVRQITRERAALAGIRLAAMIKHFLK